MKKFIAIFCFLLSACASKCTSVNTELDASAPVPSASTSASNSNINNEEEDASALPSEIIKSEIDIDKLHVQFNGKYESIPNEFFKLILVDKDTKTLVAINSSKFSKSKDAYILLKLRELRTSGAKIYINNKLTINGHEYAYIRSSRGDLHSLHLFTLKDNIGYEINCGGPQDVILEDECKDLFDSLELK